MFENEWLMICWKYIAPINLTPLILTVCDGGWYGINCTQRCIGHCLNNVVCNHVTGLCDGGCAAGWKGYQCETGKIFNKQIK